MKKIKLAGTDHAEMEIGITQDPTEITNKGGIRIMVQLQPGSESEYRCVGVERVGESGKWELIESTNIATLAMGIFNDNFESLDLPLLRKQNVFYLEIIRSVDGDPFSGLEIPFDAMDQIVNVVNPKIDEDVFLRDYAIFFLQHYPTMCESDPDYPAKYNAAIKRWSFQIANHTTAVDVVRRTSTGVEVLYTLPPIMSNASIFDNGLGDTLNDITYEAAFMSQTDPGGAEKYIADKLSEKLTPLTEKERKGAEYERIVILDNIRARYNLPRWLPVDEAASKEGDGTVAGDVAPVNSGDDKGFSDDEMGEF